MRLPDCTKVIVVRRDTHTDVILFTLDAPNPFLAFDDPPYFTLEVTKGHAEAWLESVGINEYEMIYGNSGGKTKDCD